MTVAEVFELRWRQTISGAGRLTVSSCPLLGEKTDRVCRWGLQARNCTNSLLSREATQVHADGLEARLRVDVVEPVDETGGLEDLSRRWIPHDSAARVEEGSETLAVSLRNRDDVDLGRRD